MPIIQTKGCQCAQCKHIWIPGEWRRDASHPLPRWCPKCKTARWNEGSERVEEKPAAKVTPIVRQVEEVTPVEDKPIVKRNVEKKTTPTKRQAKSQPAKSEKSGYCPHKFIRLEDGTCACPQCK
jgi:hypothetical protein